MAQVRSDHVQGNAVEYQGVGLLKFQVFRLGRRADKGKNTALTGFEAAGKQLVRKRFQGRHLVQEFFPGLLGPRDDGGSRQRFHVVHRRRFGTVAFLVHQPPVLDGEPQGVVGTIFAKPVEPAAAAGNKAVEPPDFPFVQQGLPFAQLPHRATGAQHGYFRLGEGRLLAYVLGKHLKHAGKSG